MAIISADWRWLEVNDALCRHARPHARAADRPLARRGDPPRRPRRQPGRRRPRARRHARSSEMVKRYLRPDGEVVWAAVDSIYVPGRRGDGWFYAHVQDITAKRVAAGGDRAPGAPAGGRRGARPLRARRAGPRGGDGPRRRDRRRDARRRALRGLRDHAARRRRCGSSAGVGWPDGQVRRALVPAGPETQVGYTLQLQTPGRHVRRRARRRASSSRARSPRPARAPGITVAIAVRGAALGRARRARARPRASSRPTRRTSCAPSPTSSPARSTATASTRRSATARCTTR